ncbi:MAG: hypothetical protein V3T70_01565 [Phycisphaerae bacterium]
MIVALSMLLLSDGFSTAAPPAKQDQEPTVIAANASNTQRRSRRRRKPTYKVTEVVNGGTVEGVVVYQGERPAPRKIQIVKDHETCGRRDTQVPLIRLDDEGRVAEAVVFLADISGGKDFPSTDEHAIITQERCTFHPHVQTARKKAPVDIVNSDPVAHNIRADQRVFTLFNILQPTQGMKAEKTFDRPGLVTLKCNVHDWMKAYVYVFIHPYHQVTGDDGAFKLENVPPGDYQLAVWQEHLGEQTFPVEVKPGATTSLTLELQPREK